MKYFCSKCMSESEERLSFCIACGSFTSYVPMVYVKTMVERALNPVTAQQILQNEDVCVEVAGLGKVPTREPFSVGLFGPPFGGKTTYMLVLAHKIIRALKERVLFVSWEESMAGSLAHKLRNLELYETNLLFVNNAMAVDIIPTCESQKIRWVMLDSYSVSKWSIVDLESMRSNNLVLVFSNHTTKEDEMAGSRSLEHYVDIMVEIKDGRVRQTKNRYGDLLSGPVMIDY